MTYYEIYRTPRMKLKALKLGWCWQGFFYNCIWAFSNNLWSLGFTLLIVLFGGKNGFFNLPILTSTGQVPINPISALFSLFSVSVIFLVLLKQGNCFRFFYYYTRKYQLIDCIEAENEKEAIKQFQTKSFDYHGQKAFYEPAIFNINYRMLNLFIISLFILTFFTTGKEIYDTIMHSRKWISYGLAIKILSIGLLASYIYQLQKKEWSVIPSVLLYILGLIIYLCSYTLFFYSQEAFIPFLKSPLGIIMLITGIMSVFVFAILLHKLVEKQKSLLDLYKINTILKKIRSKIKFIILGKK